MKTQISYYGGKQRMVSTILPLLPPQDTYDLYCEPAVGGGAVFHAKEPSPVEVINDLDGRVVNFYRMVKSQYELLDKLIKQTPHSRQAHKEAEHVLKNQDLYSNVKIAWAFWVQTNMSFASSIFAGFAYARKKNSCEKKMFNKREAFDKNYASRLELVQIEQEDMIKVIKSRDSERSFFYVDPPYFNSECGHYKGYTQEQFVNLLTTLAGIKGRFLLSSYESDVLQEHTDINGWDTIKKTMPIAVSHKVKKDKIEVLTANYPITKLVA